MKKLVFVGVALFGISVCADELWGKDIPVKSSSNLRSKSVQSKNSRSNRKSTSSKSTATKQREKSAARNSNKKNSENFKNSSRSASEKNSGKNTIVKSGTVSKSSDAGFSKLKLEDSVSYILKNIIGSIPSTDIRVMISNMDILSRSLPKKNRAEDIKTVLKKMSEATYCFDELLRIKSNLYLELFNQKEERGARLPDSVELDRVVKNLDSVDTKKLGEIISVCVREKLSTRIVNNLKDFSKKIKEAKKILGEIKEKFSPIMLARIEGIPELRNLEATNTAANRRLAKRREELEENKISENSSEEESDSGDSSDQIETDDYSPNENISPAESEGEVDENSPTLHKKKPEQRLDQEGEGTDESSETNGDNEKIKLKKKIIIDIWKSKAPEKKTSMENGTLNEIPNKVSNETSSNDEGINRPNSSNSSAEEEDPGKKPFQENNDEEGKTAQMLASGNNSEQLESKNPQQRPNESIESNKVTGNTDEPQEDENNSGERPSQEEPNRVKPQEDENDSSERPSQEKSDQVKPQEDENDSSERPSQEKSDQVKPQEDENSPGERPSQEKFDQIKPQEDEYDSSERPSQEKSDQVKPQEDENNSGERPSQEKSDQVKSQKRGKPLREQTSTEDSENKAKPVVEDLNDIENPEEFYKYLEANIGLLYERDFTNKQKTAFKKIKGYLKEIKSERSFEQKVSDVDRIIRGYNSLVALKPKTKDRENLPSVRRDKIKFLREKIYLEVFDDLSARVKRLQSNKNLSKLNMKEDFEKVLATNKANKKKFGNSKSGREKRQIMIDSAEAYDKLMEKIWKYPELIKAKRDREEFDRIGYTLDPVILSIDINPSR